MSSPKLFQVVHGEGRCCEVLKTTLFEEKGLCVCDGGAHLLSFSLLYLSMIPIPDNLVDWEKFDAPHRYRTSALSDSDARINVCFPSGTKPRTSRAASNFDPSTLCRSRRETKVVRPLFLWGRIKGRKAEGLTKP